MTRMKAILFLITLFAYKMFGANVSCNDSIVMNAMHDELNRNMNELVYENYNKPFFIAYTIADVEEMYVSATLGALVSSNENKNRTWFARVMVGDYEINDENYQDYNNIEGNEIDMPLPVEYDYYGIRRNLWAVTNRIYKLASLSYKNKISALTQNNLSDTSLQIPDFAKTEIINIYEPDIKINFKKENFEKLAKDISSIYKEYPDIVNSNFSIDFYKARVYYINSEGTETVFSKMVLSVQSAAEITNEDGELISDHISYQVLSPEDLPSNEEIKSDIRLMVKNLDLLKDAPTLEENYYGPVLFIDQAVAGVIEENIFGSDERLIASREPLVNSPQMKMYYGESSNNIEAKIDKRVAASDITIKAYPTLNEYKGTKLIGSFEFDAEGVKPPNEITLVENGILKTLLNGRTPTRKIPNSNGHFRHSLAYSGLTKEIGPGVISVTSAEKYSTEQLKQKLVESAKQEGLKYGIMLKPVKKSNGHQPVNIYRVWVDDGHEELLSSVYVNDLPDNAMKRIIGSTGNEIVYNTFLGNGYGMNVTRSLTRGLMVTYIVPDGMLFEEGEVKFTRKPVVTGKPVVKSPLVELNQTIPEK